MTCTRCGHRMTRRALRVRRPVLLGLWVLGLGLAWWLGGGLLHDVAEGMQRSLLPLWKLWVSALALVAAAVATALRLRRAVCADCQAGVPSGFEETADGSTRRAVLRAGGAAVAASVGGAAAVVGRNAGWIPIGRDIFGTG